MYWVAIRNEKTGEVFRRQDWVDGLEDIGNSLKFLKKIFENGDETPLIIEYDNGEVEFLDGIYKN